MGAGVIVWPASVRIGVDGGGGGGSGGRGDVLPFTISALLSEAIEKVLPSIVTAGPPGRTLSRPIAKPAGAGVRIWPATVRVGTGGGGRGDVLPLTTRASLAAKATVVPLTVAA